MIWLSMYTDIPSLKWYNLTEIPDFTNFSSLYAKKPTVMTSRTYCI